MSVRNLSRQIYRHRRSQAGETLVESLASIVILALVAIAAYNGLFTSLRSSDLNRDTAVAETLLRSAAERLQDPESEYIDRVDCPGVAGNYDALINPEPGDAEDLEDFGQISVAVAFWDSQSVPDPPDTLQFTNAEFACSDPDFEDSGLQRLSLSIETPSGASQSLDVIKRRG